MIYFAQPVAGGPIKIGCSDNVKTRLRQLEGLYRTPLVLLATMPGGRDEERAIHERFADLRLGQTEQFRPAPELMAFIRRPLLAAANPDLVEVMQPILEPMPFYLDPETRRRLKVLAAIAGLSMSQYVRRLIEECIEANSRK